MEKKSFTARIALAMVLIFPVSQALASVGNFIFVVGDVRVVDRAGKSRPAAAGVAVEEGETVLTGNNASAQLRMIDGGFIAVRSGAEMKFDEYKYEGRQDGKENAIISLIKGGFRTITGAIGQTNKSRYAVRTPSATIGIRGTDHEPFFVPPPSPGQIPPAPPGAYDKVNVGVAFMQTPAGVTDIKQNQVGYAASLGEPPRILPAMPPIFTPTPAPVAQKPKPAADKPAAEKPAAVAEKPAAEKPPAPEALADTPAAESKPAPSTSQAPEPIREVAVVDPATVQTGVAAGTTTTTAPTATTTTDTSLTRPIEATAPAVDGTATLNTTTQTVTSGTGQFVYSIPTGTTTDLNTGASFQQTQISSGGLITIGDFGLLAQQEASAAQGVLSTSAPLVQALPQLQSTASTNNSQLQAISAPSTASVQSLYDAAKTVVPEAQLAAALAQLNTANAAVQAVATAKSVGSTQFQSIPGYISTAQAALGSGGMPSSLDPAACPSLSQCSALASFYAEQATAYQAAKDFTAAQAAYNSAKTAAQSAASFGATVTSAAGSVASAETVIAQQLAIAQTAAGTTAPNALAAAQSSILNVVGDFGQLAASQAALAVAAYNGTAPSVQSIATALGTNAGVTATQAFNAASSAYGNTSTAATVQGDAAHIAGLAINTTLASGNLSQVQSLATTAAGQVSSATSVYNANANVANGVGGTDFRDSTAITAFAAMNAANDAITGTSTGALALAIQGNSAATTQNTALGSAKSSASTQLGGASSAFGTASSALSAIADPAKSANDLLSLAQAAAQAAQAAATSAQAYQAANDFANAQAQFTVAQQQASLAQGYLAHAQQLQTLIGAGGTIAAAQSQLATLKSSADSAKSLGDAGVASTTSALSTATTNAPLVSGNAIVAQYSNPTIVSTNRFQAMVLGSKPAATSGSERVAATASSQPNTNFVLDGQKNMVEARSTDLGGLKVTQGTPNDTFVAFDPASGQEAYVALGRWAGSASAPLLVDVNGTAVNMGSRSLHWIVGYQPPSFFVQSRTGTVGYARLANTSPTDAAGNVGTLSSATLSVDFATQNVMAAIGVNVASKAVSGSGTFPISGNGFGGAFGTVTSGWSGDLTGAFAGSDASGVGVAYNFFPSATPSSDLIQGVAAFRTTTPPPQADFASVANAAASSAEAARDSVSSISTALGTTKAGTASSSAISSATSAYGTTATAGTVQGDATYVAGVAAIDTATATANLGSVTTLKNNAATTASSATTAYNANVASGFADSQAAGGLSAMNSANTLVVGAFDSATTASAAAGTQSTSLASAKTSASTTLTSATTALNTANTTFNGLTSAEQSETVTNLLSLAQTAATAARAAATSAASLQSGGDLAGAQAQMIIAQEQAGLAQQYLALAQKIQTIYAQSDAILAAQSSLAGTKTAADGAKSAGDAAVSQTASALSTASAQAAIVATNAAIAQYNNPAVATLSGFGHGIGGSSAGKAIDGGKDNQANTNYVLDGSGNLVEIRNSEYIASGFQESVSGLTGANIKFQGGTAADTQKSSDNEMYMGRWQGGSVVVDGVARALGSESVHWVIVRQPQAGYAQRLTGTTAYTKIANTAPTDMAGNVGVLNSATLSADFLAQAISAAVDLTINSRNYVMSASGPISGNGFDATSASVSCTGTGCGASYSGDLGGTFGSTDASKAGYIYGIWPTVSAGANYTDLIRGAVAFATTTPPAIAPLPVAQVNIAYYYPGGTQTSNFTTSSTSYAVDGQGNISAVANDPALGENDDAYTIVGTASPATPSEVALAGTQKIRYGSWSAATVSGQDFQGAFSNRPVAGNFHWISGPLVSPFYLPEVLTVTATYTLAGGAITDHTGAAGTINSASLGINFNTTAVNAAINATIGANTWVATASNIGLDGGSFFASVNDPSPHHAMTLTLNGSATGTFGNLNGQLVGAGAEGAIMSYAFGSGTAGASGTAAFTGTAHNTSAPYVVGIVSQGMLKATGSSLSSTPSPLPTLSNEFVNSVEVIANAAGRVSRDSAQQVTKFDGYLPLVNGTGTGYSWQNATYQVRADNYPLDTPPSPGAPTPVNALTNTGSDATTGITWGRYVGFVTYSDRIGGAGAFGTGAFDLRTANWHGIWSSTQTGPAVLPTSGTVSYTFVGGTSPTDNSGIVGTLGSATLQANFTAMTVNSAVNLTMPSGPGAGAWSASANNIPIQGGMHFEAATFNNVGNLAITAPAGLTGAKNGVLQGIFTGNHTAASGGGVMTGYSLNVGGATGTTVSGVAGFKK